MDTFFIIKYHVEQGDTSISVWGKVTLVFKPFKDF